MSVSDSGAIGGARAPATGTAGPIITGPDPSPTRRGPTAPVAPNARTGAAVSDAGTGPTAATPRAAAAAAADVTAGGKRKSATSSADDWAHKFNDPRQPPAAVKHQSTVYDHMWWKNSRAEEYRHMAGADATVELRRRAVPGTEHHAARAAGGADYENLLRTKSSASGAAAAPASPPSAGGWTDRMASAAKRLKQSAADALPHVSPASDIAGELQAQAQARPHAPAAPLEAVPVSSATPTGMEWTPAAATAHATVAAQRSPKAGPIAVPPHAQVQPRAPDTAVGKSPLQKLREMVMGKAKPSPTLGPTQPVAPASPQLAAANTPRSAMSKPAVSHSAPVMDIGSPLPPYRHTEPRVVSGTAAAAVKPDVSVAAVNTPATPPARWGSSVKRFYDRVKSAFDFKPASDIKPTTAGAVADRASDK